MEPIPTIPTLAKMGKMLEATNGLVLDILKEMTQVRTAVSSLQLEVSQLQSQVTLQATEIHQQAEVNDSSRRLVPELTKVVFKLSKEVEEQSADRRTLLRQLEEQKTLLALQQGVTERVAVAVDKLERQSLGVGLQLKVVHEAVTQASEEQSWQTEELAAQLAGIREDLGTTSNPSPPTQSPI
ncbi:hypothetical protein R1sor_027215 [Riccia sorocarpa]|uniref:Uncharacterized protein n=1 Tax=Riccia sorocarpa TaxID=122646 RepID=A0ABD3GDK0_9MARC